MHVVCLKLINPRGEIFTKILCENLCSQENMTDLKNVGILDLSKNYFKIQYHKNN